MPNERPDSPSSGEYLAGQDDFGPVVAQAILSSVRFRDYRSRKALGWAGHLGNVG